MRIRTSVTLPEELVIKLNALSGKKRSEFFERALREHLAKDAPKKLNHKDIEIINRNADLINRQVEETLEFQADW